MQRFKMRKIIFLTMLTLSCNTYADGTLTITGTVEPASIVGFDKTSVMATSLVTGTHTFQDASIGIDVPLAGKFDVSRDIYIKTNTNTAIEMSISAPDNYGDLKTVDGRESIRVDYKLMNTTYTTLDGETFVELTNQANDGSDSVGTLNLKQHSNTASDQDAGTYSTLLTITIRKSL